MARGVVCGRVSVQVWVGQTRIYLVIVCLVPEEGRAPPMGFAVRLPVLVLLVHLLQHLDCLSVKPHSGHCHGGQPPNKPPTGSGPGQAGGYMSCGSFCYTLPCLPRPACSNSALSWPAGTAQLQSVAVTHMSYDSDRFRCVTCCFP